MPDIAYVDTIDVCHLRCPTCIRGLRGMENTTDQMDLEMFERVLARLRQQGFRKIGFFSWTEPFLNQTLEEYVARAKARGFWVCLSTTLSLPRVRNLEATLRAGLDLLIVSISGADQETYEINHVGGVLSQVHVNLGHVREAIDRHRLRTRVRLRMIAFDYNGHHEAPLRALASGLRFKFERITGLGEPRLAQHVSSNAEFVAEGVRAAALPSPEDRGRGCELMFNQMAIDCRGDVYLCCAMPYYPAFRLGPYLDLSPEQILVAKFTHANCRTCTMPRRRRSWLENRRLSAAFRAVGHAAPS
jgi:Radical SAM superfamily